LGKDPWDSSPHLGQGKEIVGKRKQRKAGQPSARKTL